MKNVIDFLKAIRGLVERPEAWTQDVYARGQDGRPHREPRRLGGMLVPDGRNQPCRDHDERRSGLPAQARLAALELRARPGDERAAHSRKLERRADKDARRYPRADRPGIDYKERHGQ